MDAIIKARDLLIYLSLKYEGDWEKIFSAIKGKEAFSKEDVLKASENLSCSCVTLIDPEYPSSLKNCNKPPFVLFYYGDISLIQDEKKCVAYIGSRESSSYGEEMAKTISKGVAKRGYCIVSGMARGIDRVATENALGEIGGAVGILGSGIDRPYPTENIGLYNRLKTEGLVISEYPGKVPPDKNHFPFRNRIIACLSRLIIVGEASHRSGTLITVGYALDFGKDIASLPYRADEENACNDLIKDGATLITCVDDVLNLLGYPKNK